MNKYSGFTLIELVIFIVITSIFANTILILFSAVLNRTPAIRQQSIALQTAKQCMEWFIGQRRLVGYNALACPSTPSPSVCTAPAGYTITNNISCTTLNTDTFYKTITVTVSGLGDATLTTLIADY